MKPKNKFQTQVVDASKTLPKLTQMQIEWGYRNVVEPVGHRTAGGVITCTDCSHSWQGAGHLVSVLTDCICPMCQTKLKVETTRKKKFNERYYMTVITAHKGFQVLRSVMLFYSARVGETARYNYSEVMQRWIDPTGKKYCTLARLRQTMGTGYIDSWILGTPLELRGENANNKYYVNVYDRIPTGEVYPHIKLILELKRTGYKRKLYGQSPKTLFCRLLSDNRAETLFKTGYANLLSEIMNKSKRPMDNYWQSARICIRNGYAIRDAGLWCDYIDFLRFFGKDLYNAKYVCPADLKAEHDRYMRKKAKIEEQQIIDQQKEKEAGFREVKGRFFGLVISEGNITVRVLESVAEIVREGEAMHHCVGSYSTKEDSLILSATVDGKKTETVEVSLSQLRVIQCRGICNDITPYHDQIVNLVNSNMNLIEKRLAA